MTLQMLLVYTPFLALLFVVYALIQSLRHQRQGVIAALLAFIAVAASAVAYVLTTDGQARAQLAQFVLINAAVVFIAGLLMLLIERRATDRDMNRSYGMLGLGLSILLAVGFFVTPLLAQALPATTQTAVNIAASGVPDTQLPQVLTAQTGLSTADLTTQLGSSTLAQLVSAHNGDLKVVTTALASAVDQLTASGSRAAQFLTRLGSDSTSIATAIIQGQSEGRAVGLLISGGQGGTGSGNFSGGQNTSGGNGNSNGGQNGTHSGIA